MPKCVVTNPYFDWSDDHRAAHAVARDGGLRGRTSRASPSGIPTSRRSCAARYAGLGSPAAIEYLKRLGVTAVELLPVHQFVHSQYLIDRGLRNYWGYDSIGFFAPHNEYSSRRAARASRCRSSSSMVKTLHARRHRGASSTWSTTTPPRATTSGPMLSFKGIDNAAYYRIMADDPRYYMDYTGTGNSLNMRHPHVLQLMMDSLRYWIEEMHVDGFRFDLAATLARELHEVDRLSRVLRPHPAGPGGRRG